MVDKLKKQFIPIDYKLDFIKEMQGLKKMGKSIWEYKEDIYQVLIRVVNIEANK